MAKNYLIRIGLIILSFVVVQLALIYRYINDGTIETITQLRIPFTEENSKAELMGNILLQSIIGFHGFPG